MLAGIKQIIFDLGGVILNIDYQLTEQAFIEAGITNFGALYSQLQQTPLFDQLETGKIGELEFLQQMQAISGNKLTNEVILKAWNAMLLDFPIQRLQILQQLRGHYDMYLLSNTNEIHERAFNETLKNAHGFQSIGLFFDKIYLSHRVGMRKPNAEVFKHVLDENGLKPEETLFIDDSSHHIEGAKSVGIQTIYLQKGMTIEKDIFLKK